MVTHHHTRRRIQHQKAWQLTTAISDHGMHGMEYEQRWTLVCVRYGRCKATAGSIMIGRDTDKTGP
jgi:hypothetical protein